MAEGLRVGGSVCEGREGGGQCSRLLHGLWQ